MPLTDAVIQAAKPDTKSYKLAGGGSLYLEVLPSGGKYWRFKYRFDRKQTCMSLGVYPSVSLKEALAQRDKAKEILRQGINPGEQAQLERRKALDELARQESVARFMVDNEGALSFKLGKRSLYLTPNETAELCVFLDATRDLIRKTKR
jgi:hypothetical protein